jgi:hypothetical protein
MFPLNTILAWNINIIMNKKYDNNNIIIASRAYFLHPGGAASGWRRSCLGRSPMLQGGAAPGGAASGRRRSCLGRSPMLQGVAASRRWCCKQLTELLLDRSRSAVTGHDGSAGGGRRSSRRRDTSGGRAKLSLAAYGLRMR